MNRTGFGDVMSVRDAERKYAAAKEAFEQAKHALLLARLSQPSEPPVGSDVRFEVQYRHHERAYTYVALRTDKGWLVTGKRNEGKILTWDDILELASRGINDAELKTRTP